MAMDAQAIKEAADLAAIVEGLTGEPGRNGMYHCPLCGSGSGPHHTPAFNIDPNRDPTHWHCFACHKQGDVFDLAGLLLGTDDFKEKRRQVMEWADISDDGAAPVAVRGDRPTPRPAQARQDDPRLIAEARAFRERCAEAIDNPKALAYLESRGIDRKAAHDLELGWDAKRSSIVIPYPGSDYYYTSRRVGTDGEGKYYKPHHLEHQRWNPAALDGDRVIVVEGQFDALALTLAGYGAETVALGGTENWEKVSDEIKARGYKGTVLVALDADDAGRKTQGEMLARLGEAGIAAVPLTVEREDGAVGVWEALGAKDAGEAWERDRDAMAGELGRAVAAAIARADDERRSNREKAFRATLERLHVVPSEAALGNVYAMDCSADPVPTGIRALDFQLGGGLGVGLYSFGATSSLGKTTLWGQIADNVAASGRSVLFATLEMSAEEMAAKALTRYMATHPGPGGAIHRVQSWQVMQPRWRKDNAHLETAILEACEGYSAMTGGRLRYVVADSEPTVEDIENVAQHIRGNEGQPPLVIIDYLQIMKPPDDSLSDKQAIDRNVSTLRRLARNLRTPVVVISSLNRQSYSGVVNMEAFKESGAIEYGSDVLMGLQPAGLDDEISGEKNDTEEKRKARRVIDKSRGEDPSAVEVTVLKNRWGKPTGSGHGIQLIYHKADNWFEQTRYAGR